MDERPPYVYTSTVQLPDGITIAVSTTVPAGHLTRHDRQLTNDIAELTNMGAVTVANRITDAAKARFEECPF